MLPRRCRAPAARKRRPVRVNCAAWLAGRSERLDPDTNSWRAAVQLVRTYGAGESRRWPFVANSVPCVKAVALCAQVASRAAFVRVSWWGGGKTGAWPDRALLSQCAPDSCDGAKLAAGLCAQLVRQYSDCYDARHPTGKTTRRASPAISCTLSTMTYVCTFPGAKHRCTCPFYCVPIWIRLTPSPIPSLLPLPSLPALSPEFLPQKCV